MRTYRNPDGSKDYRMMGLMSQLKSIDREQQYQAHFWRQPILHYGKEHPTQEEWEEEGRRLAWKWHMEDFWESIDEKIQEFRHELVKIFRAAGRRERTGDKS